MLFAAPRSGAPSFKDVLRTPIEQLFAQELANSIGRSLPVLAASTGVVYRFDPDTGTFEREPVVFGQLFLERPDPLGKGHLNASISYQRVKIDTFEGRDLEALHDTHRIRGEMSAPFTVPLFGIDLDTQEVTLSGTVGVTDDTEVNLTLPLLYSEFGLNLVVEGSRPFRPRSSNLGVGDLFLRAKYRLLAQRWVHTALGLVLRLPTGNEDNFQGTGDVELAPMLYLSRDPVPVGRLLRLQPYLNAGVNFDAESVRASETRWGLGVDAGLEDRFAFAVAVLGRHPFSRPGRPGLFEVPRVVGPPAPLFGIEPRRPDYYDVSVGGRVNLWRDTVFAFANAIVPLNRDGFRADVIPLAGVEATF